MPATAPRVVCILAGGGSLPREVAEQVAARGESVHIVALAGEADANFAPFPTTVVGWAQIGAMVRALRNAGCQELVIVGSVRRPDLGALRPDLGFWRNLPAILRIIAAGGDDSVLTRVIRFFEGQGFHVVAPGAAAPELLVGEGPLGTVTASPDAAADVALGFDVVRALGPFDVGQAVIVARGRVVAVEGADGTDAMLARVGAGRRAAEAAGEARSGVLVKRPKPGQELRIDLPAIGPATVRRAADAGLAGIAVLAQGAHAADRQALCKLADTSGLFVQGFRDGKAAQPAVARGGWRTQSLGRRGPSARQIADATKGAEVLAALAPFAGGTGAVVDRGHVLAVESGEGAAVLLARAGGLRQWGKRRFSRRSGVGVLGEEADLAHMVVAASAAGLAGLAVVGHPPPARVRAAAEVADRLGLFLVVLAPMAGVS
jgi:UDP-2,3-diacylglucosamine hydrolase